MKIAPLSFDDILSSLGYSTTAPGWISVSSADGPSFGGVDLTLPESPLGSLLHAVQRDESFGARVRGVYTFQTSPDDGQNTQLPRRAAVWFAEANTSDEARALHRRLWSSGAAPFLVVTLPSEVRVYTGFNYSGKHPARGLLKSAQRTLSDVQEKLSRFSSERVDSGAIWSEESVFSRRVDRDLLDNLFKLQSALQERGLSSKVTLTLIGKFLYIRYLKDRRILSREWLESQSVREELVFGVEATAYELLRLAEALEQRFGGDLFPFRAVAFDDETVRFVAGVFRGDSVASGQMALDFSVYDFSYLPVELLSSIYEYFLGQVRSARTTGAFYTPEILADYLMRELESVKPLESGMKALDPSCGSGIFLVLVYRHLIEKERRKRPDGVLSPQELKAILEKSICGVEREEEACQVAQFSLILTLLHYVEPPDLQANSEFRFPILRDRQIFCADFFDEDSVFAQKNTRFDWIIGNPPWKELEPVKEDQIDIDAPMRDWLQTHASRFSIARNRTGEAFAWRVSELLRPKGCAGLLLQASCLTNQQSADFRKTFFEHHHVYRITNFSNLVYKLFTAREPAISLIYSNPSQIELVANTETTTSDSLFMAASRPPIIHFGPLAANQVVFPAKGNSKAAWSMTIYQDEIQVIDAEEAMKGDALTWKLAFWGNHRDQRALQRLRRRFDCTLKILSKERGWNLRLGLQLRDKNTSEEEVEEVSELEDFQLLDITALHGRSTLLEVPNSVLLEIPESQRAVRIGRRAGLEVATPPHLFITSRFAAWSDKPWVLPHPQIALSAPPQDADYLRALSLYLNSSFARYLLFFASPMWGIGRSVVGLTEVEEIAVPRLSPAQIGLLSKTHRELSVAELDDDRLQVEIDNQIGSSLQISETIQILARDFVQVRLQFIQGKTSPPAQRRPTREELVDYANTLKTALDDFAHVPHQIAIETALNANWVLCAIGPLHQGAPIEVKEVQTSARYNELHSQLRSRHSQWVYVQRGLTVFDGEFVFILKSARMPEWTRSRALLDSDEVISEVLSNRK